jgi:DHA2 family multidrug resistance protein
LVAFNTLSRELFPEGSSIFHLIRNIGSSAHISISVALVMHSAKINYGHLSESVTPYAKAWQIPSMAGGWSMGSVQSLANISGEVQRQGLMIGYINAFYFYTLTALAALPLIMMVRMKKEN